jgi:hypothetical protein
MLPQWLPLNELSEMLHASGGRKHEAHSKELQISLQLTSGRNGIMTACYINSESIFMQMQSDFVYLVIPTNNNTGRHHMIM